jgi:hypothetical protein
MSKTDQLFSRSLFKTKQHSQENQFKEAFTDNQKNGFKDADFYRYNVVLYLFELCTGPSSLLLFQRQDAD